MITDHRELRPRVCIAAYLGGGYFFERKQAKTTILDIVVEKPEFMSIEFDGCFFGPTSSVMEKAFDSATEMSYFKEYYQVARREPAHKVYELQETGQYLAEKILKSPNALKQIGLTIKEVPEVASSSLCFGTLPTSMAIAYALLLDRVRKKTALKRKRWEHKRPVPERLERRIRDESLKNLVELYKREWDWVSIRGQGFYKINAVKRAIPYAGVSERMEERYSYVEPKEQEIKEFKAIVDDARDRNKGEELLLQLASAREVPKQSGRRLANIRRLIKKYPDIVPKFIEALRDKLGSLKRDYHSIQKKGYEYIMNKYIRLLAHLSEEMGSDEHFNPHRQELENVVYAQATTIDTGTEFSVHIPEKLRHEFQRRTENEWNYGMEYHLEHFLQLKPNVLFVDRNLSRYVRYQRPDSPLASN